MCEISKYRDMMMTLGVPAPSIDLQVRNIYETIGRSTKRNIQVVDRVENVNKDIFAAIDMLTNPKNGEVIIYKRQVDKKV